MFKITTTQKENPLLNEVIITNKTLNLNCSIYPNLGASIQKLNSNGIEIIDGIGFKAAKYFDIPNNNWKLDKLVPSVLEARKLCETIEHVDS